MTVGIADIEIEGNRQTTVPTIAVATAHGQMELLTWNQARELIRALEEVVDIAQWG